MERAEPGGSRPCRICLDYSPRVLLRCVTARHYNVKHALTVSFVYSVRGYGYKSMNESFGPGSTRLRGAHLICPRTRRRVSTNRLYHRTIPSDIPSLYVWKFPSLDIKNSNAILPFTGSSRAQVRTSSATPRKRRTVDTRELGDDILKHAMDFVHRVLMGAQALERRRKCPSAEEEWRKELLQRSPPGHMNFKELVNFLTDLSRRFTYRRWDAHFLAHLARIMLENEGLSAGQLSVRSRQCKYTSIPLSLVNAAYYDVGPVALNIFSALAGEQGQCVKTVFRF